MELKIHEMHRCGIVQHQLRGDYMLEIQISSRCDYEMSTDELVVESIPYS
jgi:hypothetical protein